MIFKFLNVGIWLVHQNILNRLNPEKILCGTFGNASLISCLSLSKSFYLVPISYIIRPLFDIKSHGFF